MNTRDLNRIDAVLAAIRDFWMQHPDMRLGQIIVSAVQSATPNADTFYTEDFPLVNQLGKLQKRLSASPQDSSDQSCSIEALNEVSGPDFSFESFDGWSLVVYASFTVHAHAWYAKIQFDGVSCIECPCDFSHAKFRPATEAEQKTISDRTPLEDDDLIISIDAETMASMEPKTFFIVCKTVSQTRKVV